MIDKYQQEIEQLLDNKLQPPSTYGLIYKDSDAWRPSQLNSVDWVERDAWLLPDYNGEKDGEYKCKVLEAPTGAGKTGFALALGFKNPNLRFLILCATKLEQEQYTRDLNTNGLFKVRSIRGQNNFHCVAEHEDMIDEFGITKEDEVICNDSPCFKVHVDDAPCQSGWECPYKKQDEGFSGCTYYNQLVGLRDQKIVVTNYHFALAMLNYVPEAFGKFDVIICDEGHVLDQMLEAFIVKKIYKRAWRRLFPEITLPNFEKGGTILEWKVWCQDNEKSVKSLIPTATKAQLADDVDLRKEIKRKTSYLQTIKEIQELDYKWVVEDSDFEFIFTPIWVTKDSERVLFSHGKRIVIMSGTIPNAKELTKKVGIPITKFEFNRLPYTFPVENRLWIIRPRADLNFRNINSNLGILTEAVDEILATQQSLGRKVLVHTKNYKISEYLKSNSRFSSDILTHTTRDRISILQRFQNEVGFCVLASPSMEKAVDLPGKQCECVIICKVPFPFLGTKVMQRRIKESQSYYSHETLMGMIQMAGRGVRNETDVCPTYVLDTAAIKFFQRAGNLMPPAIKEALRYE